MTEAIGRLAFIIPDSSGYSGRTPERLAVAARKTAEKTRATTVTKAVVTNDSVGSDQGKVLMSDREVDQQLVVRAQSGDKRAFELLVIKYQRKVERLLSRIVRDQTEIEDITQEAFIKAYRALANFRGESAFYTWLYRIAVNTAKNYLMGKGRRAPTSTGYDAEEAEGFEDAIGLRDIATPEAQLMSKQIGEIVNSTIDKLPEELKTAIILREIEGLSYEEIAEVLGITSELARQRHLRALKRLKKELEQFGDESGGQP